VDSEAPPPRDIAFAALGMLRCRDRLQQVLDTIPEPRRSEVASAIGQLDGVDTGRLKDMLAETVRREDAALRDAVTRTLGAGSAEAPRAIWRWVARGAGR
jgi:hypothetical protein